MNVCNIIIKINKKQKIEFLDYTKCNLIKKNREKLYILW